MSLVKKADIFLEDESDFDSDRSSTFSGEELPEDYEACGDCGFDHGYEFEEAYKWHKENPGSYEGIKGHPDNLKNERTRDLILDEYFDNDTNSVDDVNDDSGVGSYGLLNDGVTNNYGSADDGFSAKDKDIEEEDGDSAEVVVSISEGDDEPQVFKFDLPMIPGSEISEDEIVLDEQEEPEDVVVQERDLWDWQSGGLENFLSWLHGMFQKIPKHSGYDSAGIERVISWLSAFDKCISKAVRSDLNGVLDVKKIEEARHSINDGIMRSEQRLKTLNAKKKKKSNYQDESIVKQAQKISGVQGIVVTVPLLLSRVARVCINGTVSAGHDIEDLFDRQVKEYKLDKREQAEVLQLLEDMGYPVIRDRGFTVDQDFSRTGEDGMDWNQQFYA